MTETDLLDIAPPEVRTERVDIRGLGLEVRGIRNREWAMLLNRFPLLRKQAAGIELSKEELAVVGLESQVAVIAAGLGKAGDEKIEAQIMARLTDEEQARVFGVIMRLGSPDPLAVGPAAAGPAAGGDPATGSSTRSSS